MPPGVVSAAVPCPYCGAPAATTFEPRVLRMVNALGTFDAEHPEPILKQAVTIQERGALAAQRARFPMKDDNTLIAVISLAV